MASKQATSGGSGTEQPDARQPDAGQLVTGQPFTREDYSRLVGVMDLRGGLAVHAVAGNRGAYRPVPLPCNATAGKSVPGDALALARRYVKQGVRRLYIADLDALSGGSPQSALLSQIVDAQPQTEFLIDIGWRGSQAKPFDSWWTDRPNVTVILATESIESRHSMDDFLDGQVRSVALSLDFHQGQFLSRDGDLATWIRMLGHDRIGSAIVLDTAVVGTGQSRLARQCFGGVKTRAESLSIRPIEWISGGGIRDRDDLRGFLELGCNACLVATALLLGPQAERAKVELSG